MDTAIDTGERLLGEIVDAQRQINVLQAKQAEAMLELGEVRRGDAVAKGISEPGSAVSFVADEVAVELHVSTYAIQSRIHTARTVRDELPRTWAMHEAGRLDAFTLRLIAETAWTLTRASSRAALDGRVGAYAAIHTPAQLRQWLRRFVLRIEPDAATERRTMSEADRSVHVQPTDDGMAWLTALLKAEDAALLDRELTLAAKAARAGDETGERRTLRQARADVLVDRILTGSSDGTPRGRFHLGITVPLTTILGLSADPGTSSDGLFDLPASVIRELASQPGTLFSRIVTDPFGRVLDVTELGRFHSTPLARALELVDGVCAFPTCTAPAVNGDADHITEYPRGPTSGANTIHLCRRHHRMKTLRIVHTHVDHTGHHVWTMPNGRRVRSTPHLPRAHGTASTLEERLRHATAAA